MIGLDSTIALCAFRYALGRSTYIVGDIVSFLTDNWGYFDDAFRAQIKAEILDAVTKGRAGHTIDEDMWRTILTLE